MLTLDASTNEKHTAVVKPAQTCAPRYLPSIAVCNAPPKEGPVSAANDSVLKAMPNRVPNIFISGVILATVEGIRHWNAALVIP